MSIPINCGKDWVDILSALLTPTITIVGIGIAVLQLKINKDRYKHELFEKRWDQFISIRDFIGHVFSHGKMNQEEEYKLSVFFHNVDIAPFSLTVMQLIFQDNSLL